MRTVGYNKRTARNHCTDQCWILCNTFLARPEVSLATAAKFEISYFALATPPTFIRATAPRMIVSVRIVYCSQELSSIFMVSISSFSSVISSFSSVTSSYLLFGHLHTSRYQPFRSLQHSLLTPPLLQSPAQLLFLKFCVTCFRSSSSSGNFFISIRLQSLSLDETSSFRISRLASFRDATEGGLCCPPSPFQSASSGNCLLLTSQTFI